MAPGGISPLMTRHAPTASVADWMNRRKALVKELNHPDRSLTGRSHPVALNICQQALHI